MKPRTGAGRRDVLVLLRMAPLNNVIALSLFFIPPQMLLQLASRTPLSCVLREAQHRLAGPCALTAIIVAVLVNKLPLWQLPGSQTLCLVAWNQLLTLKWSKTNNSQQRAGHCVSIARDTPVVIYPALPAKLSSSVSIVTRLWA
jgi:hypothetical protein